MFNKFMYAENGHQQTLPDSKLFIVVHMRPDKSKKTYGCVRGVGVGGGGGVGSQHLSCTCAITTRTMES